MGTRFTLAAAILLSLGLLGACANPESVQASRQAAQAAIDAEDDAKCRESGAAPGTNDECRARLAEAHADEAAAQERRRIDFQRTLGAGTHDYSGR